jgi:DNA mismatch repair protein MutS
LPGVANVHLDATEHRDGIVFMHAVKPGPANRSYGLAVAKLAGVPRDVITAARKYLEALETQAARGSATPQTELAFDVHPSTSTSTTSAERELVARLANLDVDALSPREAQQSLYELRAAARDARED